MKKILFSISILNFFIIFSAVTAQDLPCSWGDNRSQFLACWPTNMACSVQYCSNENQCHTDHFPSWGTFDESACEASCDDIVYNCWISSLSAWWAAWWAGAVMIALINVTNCKNNCKSTSTTPIWLNPWDTSVWSLNLSDNAGGIDRMYGTYNLHYTDEWFKECKDDNHGAWWYCVQIGTNWDPQRSWGWCPWWNQQMRWVTSWDPTSNSNIVDPMTCRYRDNEYPSATTSPTSNNWQNLPVEIDITIRDSWWSWIGNTSSAAGSEWLPITSSYPNNNSYPDGRRTPERYNWTHETWTAKYIWSYQWWSLENCFSAWTTLNLPGSRYNSASTHIQLSQEWEHYLYVCTRDNVWREHLDILWPYRYDNTPPTFSQMDETLKAISWYPIDTKNILANNETDNYDILYDEWTNNLGWCNSLNTKCAPLVWMNYRYEKASTNNWHIDSQSQTSVYNKKENITITNLESCTSSITSQKWQPCSFYTFWCYTNMPNRDIASNPNSLCVDTSVWQYIDTIDNSNGDLTVRCYQEWTYTNDEWTICSSAWYSSLPLLNINPWSWWPCATSIYTTESHPLGGGAVVSSDWSNCNKLDIDRNVSLVDNDEDTIDGRRIYNAQIVNLCDQAWNCTSKPFSWNLYANTPDRWWLAYHTNNFNTTWVADWQDWLYALTVLRDQFGNKIIPVEKIWRNVKFDLNYSNSHLLDQYNKTWQWWVFFQLSWQDLYSQTQIWDIAYSQVCSMSSQTNCEYVDQIRTPNLDTTKWKYYFRLLWFTPTHTSYDPAIWDNIIKYFADSVNDQSNWNTVERPAWWINETRVLINSDTTLKYKPLFYTLLTTNQSSEWWWKSYPIEFNQNTDIFTDNNKIWAIELVLKNIPDDKTKLTPYVTWWVVNLNNPVTDSTWKKDCARTLRNLSSEDRFQNFGSDCSIASKDINSNLSIWTNQFGIWYILTSQGGSYDGRAWSITTHVATHYKNSNLVWNPTWVIGRWNSDWVWDEFKKSWWKDPWNLVDQFEVKVIWMIWSSDLTKKSTMILDNWWDLSNNFGGKANSKSTLTNNVRKKVTELTRWMNLYTSSTFSFTESLNDYNWFKVLYKNWGDLYINWKIDNQDKILIIVVWWNVYIKGDIQQWSNAALWIIVLDGGTPILDWNIYVHKDVTNLESFLYADGWIIRYKWNWTELLTQEKMEMSDSNNQIYIKWILRVSSTLGGSRYDNDPKCPYFITNCTTPIAQKYDLKYLSRFYFYKSFETDPSNGVKTVLHGFLPSWYLVWKIQCTNNWWTITCSDSDSSLRNIIDPTWNNPFGGIPEDNVVNDNKDYLWPVIIEYDPKIKTLNVPIFSSEI